MPVPYPPFNSPQSENHLSLPQASERDELEEHPKYLPITTRTREPTGTRKNPRTATIVPTDAPTQPRAYVSPSATSRRKIPDSYARTSNRRTAQKRRHEESENEGEVIVTLPPDPTEMKKIEYKRRQNTLAARASQKRKLEHQQVLEGMVIQLENDLMVWKSRARTWYELIKRHNIPCEPFDEADWKSEVGIVERGKYLALVDTEYGSD
jgi:hypothetical protein